MTSSTSHHSVPLGIWVDVMGGEPRGDAIAVLAERAIVLLGEEHDREDHHRWQLDTIAALHERRRAMVLGFEMFPRRSQPVLDRWSAGELSEAEFLANPKAIEERFRYAARAREAELGIE